MLVWARCGSHKKHTGTRYGELVFLHPVQSAYDIVRSSASEAWNANAQLFRLGWARCGSRKKRATTRYVALAILHQAQSVGQVVCSGRSGV
jgi:hypothetical protein